ncbi:protein arginine N-methyltransferase [Azospirillum isscasi]|uniref:Protein arginine N-methyltransferase n=1 Tax=Azospirillum isscasi TaxID=3053926 RepID=A0ABU0WCM9_9PROT|nr:protein arginine N-methyltransferase [Azospirillum isscasi]MDQ2101939.1 protein arginine N-methyltransferase [Azospirillum isscasi]
MATIEEALDIAIDHHVSGRLAEAETLYGRILEADPRNAPALHLAGVLACQTNRLDTALDRLDLAVRVAPGTAAYRVDHAKALIAAERWAAAAAAVRPALLALVPDAAEPWYFLALAEHHAGGTDAAIAALEHACALAPERGDMSGRLALLYHRRGQGHLRQSRPAPALADFRRASALLPEDAELRFLLATALLDSNRFDEAAAMYRRALSLAPAEGFILHNLGIALTRGGHTDEAPAILRRAARLDPGHIAVRDALVHLLEPRDPVEAALWSNESLALKQARSTAETPPPPGTPLRIPDGRTRNVVAFSLWGAREVYGQGALANAKAVPEVLPGWTCRFYHDDSVPRPLLAELARLGAETVEMPAGSGTSHGPFWRFLVSDDPSVARFLCRDCDSRPSAREKAAVDAWIASGLPFHVMRDHVLHTDLILAGMWGGMAGLLPPLASAIDAAADREADRRQDRSFLAEWVWPRIRGRALIHDSVHPGAGQPFPPAPDDPLSPHVGAKVPQPRTAGGGAAAGLPDYPPEVVFLPAGPGRPALAERPGRHGLMRFFPKDAYIGRSLALYGEYSDAEHRLAAMLVGAGDVVVEAGSNIGAHTVPLARTVGPSGLVHAFEPQRAVHELLAHNLAANGLGNVVLHRAAVGNAPGQVTVPVPDYGRAGNFGAVSMGALIGDGAVTGETVAVETVDGLGLDRLGLLKADVEGMEALVVEGAARSIARFRPALYLENDREEHSAELIAMLQGLGYRLWWHVVPIYDPANFAGNAYDAFPGVISLNLLGLPEGRPNPLPNLPPVTGPGQSWREIPWVF